MFFYFFILLCLLGLTSASYRINFIHTSDLHSTFDESTDDIVVGDKTEKLTYGGYARVANIISKLKDDCTVVLDSGDQFFGSIYFTRYGTRDLRKLVSSIKYDAMAFGNHEFDLGYGELEDYLRDVTNDYVNTTINFSRSTISDIVKKFKIIELTGCPIVNGEAGDQEVANIKVGIMGSILNADVEKSVFEEGDIEESDEFIELMTCSKQLKEEYGVDIVVLLSHMGIGIDELAAERLRDVDIIIGGHSHVTLTERVTYSNLETNDKDEFYPNPIKDPIGPYPLGIKRDIKNGDDDEDEYVLLSHVGAYGEHVGYLPVIYDKIKHKIDVDDTIKGVMTNKYPERVPNLYDPDSSVVDYSHPLFAEGYIEENQDIRNYVDALNNDLDQDMKTVLAKTKFNLIGGKSECSAGETSMGNVIADAYKYYYPGTQISFLNAGGIRGGADAPDITRGEVYEAVPFNNLVKTFDLEGKYIKSTFEVGLSNDVLVESGEPRTTFLQMSGIKLYYDMGKDEGSRVKNIKVCNFISSENDTSEQWKNACNPADSSAWTDLEDETLYRVATNTYILDGNDGQSDVHNNAKDVRGGQGEIDVIEAYLQKMESLEMPTEGDGRFQEIKLTGSGTDEGVVIGVVVAFMVVSLAAGILAFVFSRRQRKEGSEKLIM